MMATKKTAADAAATGGPELPDSIKLTMPDEDHHRVRDAVYACSGPPLCLRLTPFIRAAVMGTGPTVRDLERRYNEGKPFPRRPKDAPA